MSAGTWGHSLAIELTPHCNQKCDYCYNAWRDDNGASMRQPSTEALLGRVTKILDSITLERITLTGGEPFTRHDFFELLDLLKSRNASVQIISNGGVITDSLAQRLAPYQVSYVQITLNGPEAGLHDELVGGQGHFEKTLDGIRTLKKHGVTVVGCVVITQKNARRLGEILALWESLGVSYIALSRFSPAGYASEKVAELLPTRSDLIAALDQALPFARDRGFHLSVTMPIPPCVLDLEAYEPIKFGFCPVGTAVQEFALGPDGRVRNCTLHKTPLVDADLLDPSVTVEQILKSPVVADYRKTMPSFCEGCMHAESCAGGCGAAAFWTLGSARDFPDPFVWQHVDDEFGARLERLRSAGKRRLPTVA